MSEAGKPGKAGAARPDAAADAAPPVARGAVADGSGPGFFIPYRYAAQTRPPAAYPALAAIFAAIEPTLHAWLKRIAGYDAALRAFAGAPKPPVPRFAQDWFVGLDGAFAYTLVRTAKPARIVEIGSGHSTRFLARAIQDGGLPSELRCIDPAPRAALDGLPLTWHGVTLQQAPAALFADLAPGDVLFIDSSHILVPGSDVDHLLNEVLPALPPGVFVHVHDVFLPDRYPQAWAWRGYNEQNAVAALLTSSAYDPLWSSHWLRTRRGVWIEAAGLGWIPRHNEAFETSLWLIKRA